MTQDKKRKQRVRAFAAKTGMSYAAARHAVAAGNSSLATHDAKLAEQTEGRVSLDQSYLAPASSLDYVRACTLARQAFGLLVNTSELAWKVYGLSSVQGRDGDQIISKGQWLKALLRADALDLFIPKGSWQDDEEVEKIFRHFYPSVGDQGLRRERTSRGRLPKTMPLEAHRAVAQVHQEAEEALRLLETLLAPHLQYPGTLLRLKACRRLADLAGRQQAAYRIALEAEHGTDRPTNLPGNTSTLELGFRSEKISNPTAAQLRAGLTGFPGGTDSFAIYWRDHDPSTYIQAAGPLSSKGEFGIEYQAGSTEEHFCSIRPLTLEDVQDAFIWYATGDQRWKENIQWEPLDVNSFQEVPLPSTQTEKFWLTKRRTIEGYPEPGERAGKWLIFVERAKVDVWWIDISNAVELGKLGHVAQVSTARPNRLSRDPSMHVICVFTYDHSDAADVRRVRNVLREMGVTWKIAYKTNAATRAGKYRVHEDTQVSTYWE